MNKSPNSFLSVGANPDKKETKKGLSTMQSNPAERAIQLNETQMALDQKKKEVTELKGRLSARTRQLVLTENRFREELAAEKEKVLNLLQQLATERNRTPNKNSKNVVEEIIKERDQLQLELHQANLEIQTVSGRYAALRTEHQNQQRFSAQSKMVLKQEYDRLLEFKQMDVMEQFEKTLTLNEKLNKSTKEVESLKFELNEAKRERDELLRENRDQRQQLNEYDEALFGRQHRRSDSKGNYDEYLNVLYTRREHPWFKQRSLPVAERSRGSFSGSNNLKQAYETRKEGSFDRNTGQPTTKYDGNARPPRADRSASGDNGTGYYENRGQTPEWMTPGGYCNDQAAKRNRQ